MGNGNISNFLYCPWCLISSLYCHPSIIWNAFDHSTFNVNSHHFLGFSLNAYYHHSFKIKCLLPFYSSPLKYARSTNLDEWWWNWKNLLFQTKRSWDETPFWFWARTFLVRIRAFELIPSHTIYWGLIRGVQVYCFKFTVVMTTTTAVVIFSGVTSFVNGNQFF